MIDLSALTEIGSRQHGMFTRRQAAAAGFDDKRLARLTKHGVLEVLSPRVLRFVAANRTDEQHLLAAVLDTGAAAASHDSAGTLWAVPSCALLPAHVLVHRDGHGRTSDLGIVHSTRHLPDHHLTVTNGIPVTTPTRTLFDLSAVYRSRDIVERAMESLWSRRLVTWSRLTRMLEEHRVQGRSRVRLIEELLDERGPNYAPCGSSLELRVRKLLREAGEAGFRQQVDCGDDDEWIGRMDFVDTEAGIIIEVDGDLYHASKVDQRRDEARREALRRQGWIVVVVTEHEVWHQPWLVLDRLRAARRDARRHRATA